MTCWGGGGGGGEIERERKKNLTFKIDVIYTELVIQTLYSKTCNKIL